MKKIYLIGAITVIIIGGGLYGYFSTRQPNFELVKVSRGDVAEDVNLTGTTKALAEVDLAFETGGRIVKADAKVGDQVKAGFLLAQLDQRELGAQVNQASSRLASAASMEQQQEAALQQQQIKLDELKRGTRPEEISIAQSKVDSASVAVQDAALNVSNVTAKAETDLASVYSGVQNALNDAYIKADDAIRKQINDLFVDPEGSSPSLNFQVTDNTLILDITQRRAQSSRELNSWKAELQLAPSPSRADLDLAVGKSKTHLLYLSDFLGRLTQLMNITVGLNQTTLGTYKASVTTARTNINSAITSVDSQAQAITSQKSANQNLMTAAQTGYNAAQNSLTSAQKELQLKIAGPSGSEIAAQESMVRQYSANLSSARASVREAQAQVQLAAAQFAKTKLLSPIDGIVTKQDGKIGEIASAGAKIITVISPNIMEIEANVPEVDIGRVSVSLPVAITIDALPGEDFHGQVSYIDPAATIIDGVANYKTKILLDKADDRIKSGLTANLKIETKKKTGVLVIPQFAVLDNEEGVFAKKIVNGNAVEVPITTGLRSEEGLVEITGGLAEGDEVINIASKK